MISVIVCLGHVGSVWTTSSNAFALVLLNTCRTEPAKESAGSGGGKLDV
jgi:hypothetical protein